MITILYRVLDLSDFSPKVKSFKPSGRDAMGSEPLLIRSLLSKLKSPNGSQDI